MELHDLPGDGYVSTGRLPPPDHVRQLVDEAHARFGSVTQGEVSGVYPALARVPADLFGICVVGTEGAVHAVGDADHAFAIMSVSKPFVFALVCDVIGATGARERLGVNATGLPFNAVTAIERTPDGRTNPMVNPGAIATTSLASGAVEPRPSASVESTAYFVVSEALTNVTRHAGAAHAAVSVVRSDGSLVVEVRDDGVGGAKGSAGSGLTGLRDRVAAVGGTFEISSPTGGPTTLRAVLPCA